MTRSARRILIGVGAFLALLLVLAVLLPLLFGDRIAARVKTAANESLDAKVDWRDQSLGLFRDFPNLSLGLDDLTVVGVGTFEGDTLVFRNRLADGMPAPVRSTWRRTGPDGFRVVRERAGPEGWKEFLAVEYRRLR